VRLLGQWATLKKWIAKIEKIWFLAILPSKIWWGYWEYSNMVKSNSGRWYLGKEIIILSFAGWTVACCCSTPWKIEFYHNFAREL